MVRGLAPGTAVNVQNYAGTLMEIQVEFQWAISGSRGRVGPHWGPGATSCCGVLGDGIPGRKRFQVSSAFYLSLFS